MKTLREQRALFCFYRGVIWLSAIAVGLLLAAGTCELAAALADPGSSDDHLTYAIAWAFLAAIQVTLLFFLRTWQPT